MFETVFHLGMLDLFNNKVLLPKCYLNIYTYLKSYGSINFYYYFHGSTAPCGPGPPHSWSFMITLLHTILGKTHLDKWSAQHLNLLPDNTQHSHKTDIHATSGIRTCNPSKREVADPCLRMQGHWDGLSCCSVCIWNLDCLHNRSKVLRYLITQ